MARSGRAVHADQLDPALIPANLDREATVRELDGVVTSCFIRALKPVDRLR